MYQVVHYTRKGRDIFQDWLDGLRDIRARTAIARAVKRLEQGNFGVHRFCRSGVWELVLNIGENIVVLLLNAGDKSTQQKDIERAIEYLQDYRKENE